MNGARSARQAVPALWRRGSQRFLSGSGNGATSAASGSASGSIPASSPAAAAQRVSSSAGKAKAAGEAAGGKAKVAPPRPGYSRRERSVIDTAPKLFVFVMGMAAASGTASVIIFNEMSNCEGGVDTDSVICATEPVTSTKFPLTLIGYAAPDSTHWLVAKTVRCMLGLCSIERARAYSYAVYVTDEGAKMCGELKSADEMAQVLLPKKVCELEMEQSNPTSNSEDAAFISAHKFEGQRQGYVFKNDVANGGLGYHRDQRSAEAVVGYQRASNYPSMVLRLVMLHNVAADHVSHGFDKALLGRIRQVQGGARGGPGKEAVRQLNQMLNRRENLEKGLVLEFVRMPHGQVSVRVNGSPTLLLESEAFSWALFDAFLGPKGHMGSDARLEFVERTHEVVSMLDEDP